MVNNNNNNNKSPTMAKNWLNIGWSIAMVMAFFGLLFSIYNHFNAVQQEMYLRQDRLNKFEEIFNLISLAKAHVVIAEDVNQLQFAGMLRDQVRDLEAEMRQSSLTSYNTTKAATVIDTISIWLYDSLEDGYDIEALIKELKSRIWFIERQMIDENIVAKDIPKELYCLGIMLLRYKYDVTSYLLQPLFRDSEEFARRAVKHKEYESTFENQSLNHICIFSDNIIGTSIVFNSTVSNYQGNQILVFHIMTSAENYEQMVSWFFSVNHFHGLSWVKIDIQNFEDVLNRKFFTFRTYSYQDYLKLLEYQIFFIPHLFPALRKVVVLDDDVIVQKDLTPLFSLNMEGRVNGAVEDCTMMSNKISRHTYRHYIDFSHPLISAQQLDPDACAWEFGVNVFDLIEWRKKNLTGIFQSWITRKEKLFLKAGKLPVGLLTFGGLVMPLDPMWHVLLSDADVDVDHKSIEQGAILHYNWKSEPPKVKKGMEKFRYLRNKYVNFSHPLLQQCQCHG